MKKAGKNFQKSVMLMKAGNYLRLVQKDGWEFFERVNCSGVVVVLALNARDEILLVEQYRIPVGKNVVELPAGLINDNIKDPQTETACRAARRELLEETGYKARRVVKILEGAAGGGVTTDILTFCMALGARKVAEGGGDETEDILVHEVPVSQVERWLMNKKRGGCLIDPKIYAGLYFINKYNEDSKRRLS